MGEVGEGGESEGSEDKRMGGRKKEEGDRWRRKGRKEGGRREGGMM